MTKKLLIAAGLAVAMSTPLAQAQEYGGGWGDGGHDRWERMRYLRRACEYGDERACWRLRRMRHEWRERREYEHRQHERDWDQRPREPYQHQRDWDRRPHGYDGDQY